MKPKGLLSCSLFAKWGRLWGDGLDDLVCFRRRSSRTIALNKNIGCMQRGDTKQTLQERHTHGQSQAIIDETNNGAELWIVKFWLTNYRAKLWIVKFGRCQARRLQVTLLVTSRVLMFPRCFEFGFFGGGLLLTCHGCLFVFLKTNPWSPPHLPSSPHKPNTLFRPKSSACVYDFKVMKLWFNSNDDGHFLPPPPPHFSETECRSCWLKWNMPTCTFFEHSLSRG